MTRAPFLLLALLPLSACAGVLPGNGSSSFDLNKFLTDPTCAHDDKISGITGAAGVPASLQFSAERHCPGNAAPVVVVPSTPKS